MVVAISDPRVDWMVASVEPVAVIVFPGRSLPRREDGEADSSFDELVQNEVVDGRLAHPHPGRSASEAMPEIGDSPHDLRAYISGRGQGQDRVVISLRNRVPMSQPDSARLVCGDDPSVRVGMGILEPAEKGGPNIERNVLEVVYENRFRSIWNLNERVGTVALRVYSLVPVREGS